MSEPQFSQANETFSMTCGVAVNIRANAERVWSFLTDSANFPNWNSTVTKIEGQIREGEKLKVHVPGTDRTFAPTVTGVVPSDHMIWSGGFAPVFKGVRTFHLSRRNDGSTDFSMQERFAGLMLPLVKKSLPDFGPVFVRYANDLKNAAEGPASGA